MYHLLLNTNSVKYDRMVRDDQREIVCRFWKHISPNIALIYMAKEVFHERNYSFLELFVNEMLIQNHSLIHCQHRLSIELFINTNSSILFLTFSKKLKKNHTCEPAHRHANHWIRMRHNANEAVRFHSLDYDRLKYNLNILNLQA